MIPVENSPIGRNKSMFRVGNFSLSGYLGDIPTGIYYGNADGSAANY